MVSFSGFCNEIIIQKKIFFFQINGQQEYFWNILAPSSPNQKQLVCLYSHLLARKRSCVKMTSLSTLSRVLRTGTELWVRHPQSHQWRDGTRRVATRRAAVATEWLDKLGLHWDCLKTGRHSKIWLWHSVCNFRDGDCCPWCRRKVLVLHYCTSKVAASVS